ncbi:MAG: MotA/TolQ/ExbB proton channel family protein [Verrucomicrobiae bacterium]|nr:MotA/TolQ/ExbB proton channel family protein [Verrucomicrobiae bacterium]
MKTSLLWVLAGMLAGGSALANETLTGLQAGSASRLEAALAELSELRQRIEAERLPLAESVNGLERQVLDRRRELDRAERANENALVVLNAERALARARGEEVRFVEALLGEYLRVFETRIHIAEVDRWAEGIGAAKESGSGLGREPSERLEGMLGVIDLALDRLGEVSGGARFEGKALTAAGRLETGTFRLLGPVAYFTSGESDAAGLAELQLGSAGPTVVPLGPQETGWIRAFSASGAGPLPVDVTGGNALKLARTKDGLVEHVKKGGPVMVPILALGLFAVGMFGGKWFQLARVRIATPLDLQGILASLKAGNRDQAMAKARGVAGPVGRMIERAIGHVDEPKEYIEEVMYEEMLQTKPRMEKWLPFIALSAAAAPLLGLLGTVTGMINTFNMITVFGTGDPKTLAGGISEALITTEFGLIVAIPSLLLHSVLSRKVKAVLGSMEQTTVAFINGLEQPGLKGAATHGHA